MITLYAQTPQIALMNGKKITPRPSVNNKSIKVMAIIINPADTDEYNKPNGSNNNAKIIPTPGSLMTHG